MNPFKWWENYKLMRAQSAGLLIALECMDVQISHIEGRVELAEQSKNNEMISSSKGSLRTLRYWRNELQRVYDGAFLK